MGKRKSVRGRSRVLRQLRDDFYEKTDVAGKNQTVVELCDVLLTLYATGQTDLAALDSLSTAMTLVEQAFPSGERAELSTLLGQAQRKKQALEAANAAALAGRGTRRKAGWHVAAMKD